MLHVLTFYRSVMFYDTFIDNLFCLNVLSIKTSLVFIAQQTPVSTFFLLFFLLFHFPFGAMENTIHGGFSTTFFSQIDKINRHKMN